MSDPVVVKHHDSASFDSLSQYHCILLLVALSKAARQSMRYVARMKSGVSLPLSALAC
jgi:hypothetical protein